MKSIYDSILRAGIPHDHHETDLYVPDTPEARKILADAGCDSWKPFDNANRPGEQWLDIPFAYMPAWEQKCVLVGHRVLLTDGKICTVKTRWHGKDNAWLVVATGPGQERSVERSEIEQYLGDWP